MPDDHERIEELLSGYALLALDGEDAVEADRLLTEHVPTCPRCRRTLAELQGVASDLALSADPAPTPDLLLARIHRGMQDVPLSGRPRRRGAIIGLAASLAALVAMGGVSLAMANRATRAEGVSSTALRVISALSSPNVEPVSVQPQGTTPEDAMFVEVSSPAIRRIFVISRSCPDPAPGMAYQLWLGSGGSFVRLGQPFSPSDGDVMLELRVDVSRYDEIWITEEVAGSTPSEPNPQSSHSWRGTLS